MGILRMEGSVSPVKCFVQKTVLTRKLKWQYAVDTDNSAAWKVISMSCFGLWQSIIYQLSASQPYWHLTAKQFSEISLYMHMFWFECRKHEKRKFHTPHPPSKFGIHETLEWLLRNLWWQNVIYKWGNLWVTRSVWTVLPIPSFDTI